MAVTHPPPATHTHNPQGYELDPEDWTEGLLEGGPAHTTPYQTWRALEPKPAYFTGELAGTGWNGKGVGCDLGGLGMCYSLGGQQHSLSIGGASSGEGCLA